MPTGLKEQFPEIHVMDSLSITQTRTNLAETHRQTEKSIRIALIEHYTQVLQETEKQMDRVERAISSHMHKDPRNTSTEYRRFLNKLERYEASIQHNLQRKRQSKLSRLNPHTRNNNSPRVYAQVDTMSLHKHTHTHFSPPHTLQVHRGQHTPEGQKMGDHQIVS